MWLLLLYCWQALAFPSIPRQYSVTVAVNYVDLGYTITYNEFYDGLSTPNGTLFTEGRFGDVSTSQIVDYNKQVVTEWTSNACYNSTFSQLNSTWLLGASMQFFSADLGNFTGTPVFVGTIRSQTETRGVLCDKWATSFTNNWGSNTSVMNGTISYYFAANNSFFGQHSEDVGTVPVRVWFVGTLTNTTDNSTVNFERVYDWVSFNHGIPPGFIFKVPAVCTPNPGAQLVFQSATPTSSLVQPAPDGSAVAPLIPTDFRMLVERKIREDNVMTDITTINWWRDHQHKSERVDLFKNNLAQSVVYIYQTAALYDGAGYVYNNSGTQCLKLAIYDRAQCASSSCTTARLTPQNVNPLLTRDGGFARVFDNGTWFQNAQYAGRSPARGVNADMWTKDFTFLSPTLTNVIIAYTQSIYFFPRGWQFPGRNLPANTTFPLRIINEGSMRCLGTGPCNLTRTVQFSDMYDIYQFVPGMPPVESLQQPCASCFDGIQNQGEAGIDCGTPCAQPCQQSPGSLPFPKIAKSYLVSVSANIIENGYTMSYNEYYDSTYNGGAGALLTEGFFADLRQLQLIDYKTRKAYRWTPGGQCFYTPLDKVAGYNATYGVGPSSRFFTAALKSVDKLYYWGKVKSTSETRGILCNKWETLTTSRDNNSELNISLTYYFAVVNSSQTLRNADGGSVPIRVNLRAIRSSVKNPALDPVVSTHTYDWTDWQNIKPPAFIFTPPACVLTNNFSRFDSSFTNLSNTVVAEPRPNSINFRPFPQSFRMVVEAKLNEGNKSTSVWSANWFLDGTKERVDFQPQGSAVSSSLWFDYKSKSLLWDGAGIVDTMSGFSCYKIAFTNAGSCQAQSCKPNQNITTNTSSPIVAVRDGGFARLFGPDKTLFAGSVYVGRKLARGINADVFMKQQNRTAKNGDKYNYFQSVYYFPDGWQFPGRPPYATSVPLRVIHEGQFVTKAGVTTQFYDVFDIFQLRPGTPPADTFDSRCPDPVAPEDTSENTGKVIGGIVIALVILCILAGIVYWVRKRRSPPEVSKDMQL